MGVRGELSHGVDARKRLAASPMPLTRALRAASAAPPSAPAPAPVHEDETFVVRPRTFPFPPPRAPLAVPLAAKNTPRKTLLKRWRGARRRDLSRDDTRRALDRMRDTESELRDQELAEIVALAATRAHPADHDLRRLRAAVHSACASARHDLVRVAARHAPVVVGPADHVTLALHEMDPQARAEVQVVLDRDRGRQTIVATDKLQIVRGRIEQMEKCGVKVVGVDKMSPI